MAFCMCEDQNIDLRKYERERNTIYINDHFLSMALYPLINKPSHIKRECHTIIDNILTNVLHENLSSGTIIDDKSDHFQIFCCIIFIVKNENVSTEISYRKNDDKALDNINYVLELINRNPVCNYVSVYDALDNFVHIFLSYYNRCFPWKNSQNHNKVQIKCGLHMDWKMHVEKKNKLYTNYASYPTIENEQNIKIIKINLLQC